MFPDRPGPIAPETLVRQANIQYFRGGAYMRTTWMGVPTAKCPGDMWMYQELICALRPDVLVETGTWAGGSALYFAHVFDQLGHGRVLTIDVDAGTDRPAHPRITYHHGSSVDPATVTMVAEAVRGAGPVMVILDSDHRRDHVLAELRSYAPLVTPGSYLIVEDTTIDHHPAWPEHGPGPAAAVEQFLAEHPEFEADRDREHHLLSFAPGGFLRRTH